MATPYSKYRTEERKKHLNKTGVDLKSARSNRRDDLSDLRKEKRAEKASKMRTLTSTEESPPSSSPLDELGRLLRSADPAERLSAAIEIRKLLSSSDETAIQRVIDAGLVPTIVEMLSDRERLQYEASWMLTNLVAGRSPGPTVLIVQLGAVPILVHLLASPSEQLRQQCLWALANVAGEGPTFRDHVLACGVLPLLAEQFRMAGSQTSARQTAWLLANLLRGKPPPPAAAVASQLPLVARLLFSTDAHVVTDACWALSYASAIGDGVRQVLDLGIGARIVELLSHPAVEVRGPALRLVGNIAAGRDEEVDALLGWSPDLFSKLRALLHDAKKSVRSDACWILSNLMAGTRRQIQAAIDAGVVPDLVRLAKDGEFELKKHAAWAFSNSTACGSREQAMHCVSRGCLAPLCALLASADAELTSTALSAVENILRADGSGLAVRLIEKNGLEQLEDLQYHQNSDLYERAVRVLDRYFAGDRTERSPMSGEYSF